MKKVVCTDQRAAWAFTDWLDSDVCRLCWEVAKSMDDGSLGVPDLDEFEELMYEKSDVGGIRDAIIMGAQDVMDCELVWDCQF